MEPPGFVLDIFLQPGEFYFSDKETRIRTILGSCVAITFWHPRLFIGGMCHYMLPANPKQRKRHDELNGKYADDAIALFLHETRVSGTRAHEYEIKLFGGGNQFPGKPQKGFSVSDKNVSAALELLRQHKLHPKAQHIGGTGHRNIIFELWSGDVWVKHVDKVME